MRFSKIYHMKIVEKDILNFRAAMSRARRRAKSKGVAVALRRVPLEPRGSSWEVVWDDGRDEEGFARIMAEMHDAEDAAQTERDIRESQAIVDKCEARDRGFTGRVAGNGATNYVSAEYEGTYTPELEEVID